MKGHVDVDLSFSFERGQHFAGFPYEPFDLKDFVENELGEHRQREIGFISVKSRATFCMKS